MGHRDVGQTLCPGVNLERPGDSTAPLGVLQAALQAQARLRARKAPHFSLADGFPWGLPVGHFVFRR